MELSPQDREAVIERAAERLAAAAIEEMGGIGALVVLDLGTVAQCLGISKARVREHLPVRRVSARTSGVTLADVRAYLDRAAGAGEVAS